MLVLTFFLTPVFAGPENRIVPEGPYLSSETYAFLESKGFIPQKKELCSTGSDDFAYNISIDFNGLYDSAVVPQTLLIAISQEDFFKYRTDLYQLLKTIENASLHYPVQFIFTALDNRNYSFPGYNKFLQGTENFARQIEDPETYFALILNFGAENRKKPGVFTTGNKYSTPMWLTKEITESFIQSGISFAVPQKLLSLYRAGLLFGDEQMGSFFKQGISCIKVELRNQTDITAIETFILNHQPSESEKNDIHYSFFTAGTYKSFWINEFFNILSLEVFGTFIILFLVCFTFVGKTRVKYKKIFSKYWFIIPLTITISLLTLYAGQFLCEIIPLIKNTNPVGQFACKLFISTAILSGLFIFQELLNLPSGTFLFGFMITLISIINIFIFSVADITLFWTFVIEFIIIRLTRNFHKTWQFIAAFFLMLVPYMPFFAVYFLNVSQEDIKTLIFSTATTNIMLSLILFPFQITWLRILLRLRTSDKTSCLSFKKMALYSGVSLSIITLIILSGAVFVSEVFYSKNKTVIKNPEIIESGESNLKVSVYSHEMPQLSTHSLKINSEVPAERYEISVSSEGAVPVLDSLYEYSLSENSKKALFVLPDFPPKNISIDFASEKNISCKIKVKAWYKTDKENTLLQQTKTINISPESGTTK